MCSFCALLATIAYKRASGILFTPEGFLNLFDHLAASAWPALLFTVIICSVIGVMKWGINGLLNLIPSAPATDEDDSFVYTVEDNTVNAEELSG